MSSSASSRLPTLTPAGRVPTGKSFPNSQTPSSKSRTSHACDRCRLMRTKCSGGKRCAKCIKDDATCFYGDRKRERNKKDLAESSERIQSLEEQNRALASVVKALSSNEKLSPEEQAAALQVLSKYAGTDEVDSSHPSQNESHDTFSSSGNIDLSSSIQLESEPESHGEARTGSSVGSPGHHGELPHVVSLDSGGGACGYVGKISSISWIQRAREYLFNDSQQHQNMPPTYLDTAAPVLASTAYFVDDEDLLSIDEDFVESAHWPPFDLAVILTEAYFNATDGAVGFFLRAHFLDAMMEIAQRRNASSWANNRWLAKANLVWAVGAKWLRMMGLDRSLPQSHMVYYARARAFGLDHRVLMDHPDIDMVEGVGLLGFYLFVNGSISRAWSVIGHAIRHAISLGLHLEVSEGLIEPVEMQRRARVWCSLYHLEIRLGEVLGRPCSVRASIAAVSLDLLDEDSYVSQYSANQGHGVEPYAEYREIWLKFLDSSHVASLARASYEDSPKSTSEKGGKVVSRTTSQSIRLTQISEEIFTRLYRDMGSVSWAQIQQSIMDLQVRLTNWADSFPEGAPPDTSDPAIKPGRRGFEIAMYYQSAMMMLHRICLCEINIEDESDQSKEFNQQSARACVQAALYMVRILPHQPVASEILFLLPWWVLLHYLCQAASVLIIELCLDVQHLRGETVQVVEGLGKTMVYINYMARRSRSAEKASNMLNELVSALSQRYMGLEAFSNINNVRPPVNWTFDSDEVFLPVME